MSAPEWGDKKEKENLDDNSNWNQKEYFKIKNKPELLILIGGPSGSGKGELAKKVQQISTKKITILPTDNYSRRLEKPKEGKWRQINFAHPDTFNKKKFLQDLETLANGKSITYPNHLHPENNSFYEGDSKRIAEEMGKEFVAQPAQVIIAEGYHSLQCPELRDMSPLKIYVHADPDNLLMWKIKRGPWYKKLAGEEAKDPRNFGSNVVEAFDRWVNSSRISSKKYIEPTKEYADLVVANNSQEEFDKNLIIISELIDIYFQGEDKMRKKLKESKSISPEDKIKDLEKQLDALRQTDLLERERERESNIWKSTTLYWGIGIGTVGTLVGLGIYWLFRRKVR